MERRLKANDEDRGGRSEDANRVRTTGAALEAHYRFVLWLVPAMERFSRKRQLLLGAYVRCSDGPGFAGREASERTGGLC